MLIVTRYWWAEAISRVYETALVYLTIPSLPPIPKSIHTHPFGSNIWLSAHRPLRDTERTNQSEQYSHLPTSPWPVGRNLWIYWRNLRQLLRYRQYPHAKWRLTASSSSSQLPAHLRCVETDQTPGRMEGLWTRIMAECFPLWYDDQLSACIIW